MKLARQYGFERIFTCLLSVDGDKEKIIADFKASIAYAKELGMEVICDISPRIFQALEISYDDLSFFHDLGRWDTFRSWLYW